jgi:hypothetical protein
VIYVGEGALRMDDGIDELVGDRPNEMREYMEVMVTLGENRNLKEQIEEAREMLSQLKIEETPFYELGLEQGIECGALQKQMAIVGSLIGILDDEVIAENTELPLEEVKRLH